MGIRALSSFIALPLLVAVLWAGGITLYIAAMIIALVGLYELYHSLKAKDHNPVFIWGLALTVAFYLPAAFGLPFRYIGMFVFFVLALFLIYYLYSKKHTILDLALTIFGVTYVPLMFFHVCLTKHIKIPHLVWYIFLIAWLTDTCAYFGGYFFGRHKLWEEISPKKTIEGAIAGVIGCMILTAVIAWVINPDKVLAFMPMAMFGSILSQMGDLIASKIKRYTGVKDFGKIMPGHGGVLDRFDSVLMTAPLVYYYGLIITEVIPM